MSSEIKPLFDKIDNDIELNNINEIDVLLLKNNNKENLLKHLTNFDLFFLTVSMAGVQFTWSIELAYGTPYLLSLGLPKSLTALVWLAGPLSGLIIQPLIGFYSDKCTSKYGRRRPYIIAGTLLVVISVMLISYSKEIGSFLAFGNDSNNITIWIAVSSFYCLDFAINIVQTCCRALFIDMSGDQQNNASIWASRMLGIGNICGFFMGFIDLKSYFPFLGSTQLKCLCLISNATLIISVILTCINTNEKVFSLNNENYDIKWYSSLIDIIQSMKKLPEPIQKICNVQFWSWIGWFPFLFYTTAWIDFIYFKNNSEINDGDNKKEEATRTGSFALLINSIISLIASFLLPLVKSYYENFSSLTKNDSQTFYKKVWVFSEIFLALAFFSSIAVNKVWQAIFIISLCGIPWAVSSWIPFTFIGEYLEIYNAASKNDEINKVNENMLSSGIILGIHNMYVVLPQLIVTLLNSIFFALVKFMEIQENNFDSFGWILRFGGIGAIISSFLVPKINFNIKKM